MRKMCLEVKLWLEKRLIFKNKEVFLILKMSFKIPLKIMYWKGRKGKIILVAWWWTEEIAYYESYGKTLKTMNKTSENMTYLIDNKNFLCQHNKLHPLRARRGKWISEKLYREIETIIKKWFTEMYHFRGWRRFIKSEMD